MLRKTLLALSMVLFVSVMLVFGRTPQVAVPLMCAYCFLLYRYWQKKKAMMVVVRGNSLVQTDSHGNEVSSIDLTAPYKAHVDYFPFMKSVFTVKQQNATVQFSSDAENARHIAMNVLRLTAEWPPVDPSAGVS